MKWQCAHRSRQFSLARFRAELEGRRGSSQRKTPRRPSKQLRRRYAVEVASERSAADVDAVFRSLQAKFPNQLGGREPIVGRTVLNPEGIYYRALIGPFASLRAAAGVCNSLEAAGEGCLVAEI